jgi:hypothetical protein
MNPKDGQCPHCHQKGTLRRSRPRWYDLPFRFAGMKAWRCMLCNRRFHVRKRPMVMVAAR